MPSTKKIVEEVSGWLRVLEDGTVDREFIGPPEVEFLTKPVPPHEEFIDGVAVRDLKIDPDQGFAVRIYIPERNKDIPDQYKQPIILHFHGGGFCISRPDWFIYYHFYANLVRSAQVICISVFLRLAPEYRLPTACKDSFAAFLWLMSVAKGECPEPWLENFADFRRVFLIGDSTGGNIVHHVADRAGAMDTEPVSLAGGIAIHPCFQRAEPSKSYLELPETPLLTRDMISKFMALALPKGSTMDHPIVCPVGPDAPPLAGQKFPPIMVVVADMDLLRDTELEYCEAMKEAGKEVEVLINEGMSHSFYLNKIAVDNDTETANQANKLIEGIKSFIDRH